MAAAANEFDPYREALVIESITLWPDEYDDWDAAARARLEQQLHADPKSAAQLTYERQHSGFTRIIRVTAEDIKRLT